MLHTQKFIQEKGWEALTTELGIKVKEYPEGLVVLNYDQIESPKSHPVVMECRSLILDKNTLEVISIAFDRFFNYGEVPDETGQVDFSRSVVFEKADGSLVKVYYCKLTGRYEISTRSLAFAEGDHLTGGTFREKIIAAMGFDGEDAFQNYATKYLHHEYSFIFEYIGPENRIVTRYSEPQVVLLAIRDNMYPHHDFHPYAVRDMVPFLRDGGLNVRAPKIYVVSTAEAAQKAAEELGGLQEGFVVCDPVSGKRCKIKSPAYVAVHHLRDNGVLSPKRVAELVLTGEEEEYLTYFPEDRPTFEPIILGLKRVEHEIQLAWESHKDIEAQKDFALAVKDYPFSGVLFSARKFGNPVMEVFKDTPASKKVELVLQYS